MTPEQKAAELINKMYYTQSSPASWVQAKECALIAVNEILNEIPYHRWENEHQMTRGQYWEEVKQEIEKL